MQEPAPVSQDDPEVVVLFTDAITRLRVRGCLERRHYRVAQPERLLEWVATRRPHVVVVTGDDDRAAQARAAIMRTAPEAACVVLAQDPTTTRYRELLATCTAVLPISATEEDIAVAVAGAWRDLTCLPTSAARTLTDDSPARPSTGITLTAVEVTWLQALAEGATVAALARRANYSPRKMYRLLNDLYTRLGATGRTDALMLADRMGLLTPATSTTAVVPGMHQPHRAVRP